MKKLIALLLALCLVMSFAACGKTAEAEVETEVETEVEAEVEAEPELIEGVANPMVETTNEEMGQTLGFNFAVPAGATDCKFFIIADTLGEMQFQYNGVEMTARMKAVADVELVDISGMYYTWTDEQDVEVKYCEGKLMTYAGEDTTIEACIWLDVVPGVAYSVTAQGTDLDGFDLLAIADEIFVPLQGDS